MLRAIRKTCYRSTTKEADQDNMPMKVRILVEVLSGRLIDATDPTSSVLAGNWRPTAQARVMCWLPLQTLSQLGFQTQWNILRDLSANHEGSADWS